MYTLIYFIRCLERLELWLNDSSKFDVFLSAVILRRNYFILIMMLSFFSYWILNILYLTVLIIFLFFYAIIQLYCLNYCKKVLTCSYFHERMKTNFYKGYEKPVIALDDHFEFNILHKWLCKLTLYYL